MNVAALLDELRRLDVRAEARDGRLRLDAPRGSLTPDLAEQLKAQKSAVLAALRERSERRHTATNPARQPAMDLLMRVHGDDPDLAMVLWGTWTAAIDEGRARGLKADLIEKRAVRAAEQHLRHAEHERWAERVIQEDSNSIDESNDG